uniref:Uncharacterized protein n=1 Tax=Strongyloides stercoralis TaxID=6248 RepID=A0A0K0ED44_STRER
MLKKNIFCWLLLITKGIIFITGFSYPNFISKLFRIEVNVTLQARDLNSSSSDNGINIVIGGKINHDLKLFNLYNNNKHKDNHTRLYNNFQKSDCILFATNYQIIKVNNEEDNFILDNFEFVNEQCIWTIYFTSLQSITSCIPIIDFFALYTKDYSNEPEKIFNKFSITISMKLNEQFAKNCMELCNNLTNFLKEYDVSYIMPPNNKIILNEKVIQKFTRKKKSFIMEPAVIEDINNSIFNCRNSKVL